MRDSCDVDRVCVSLPAGPDHGTGMDDGSGGGRFDIAAKIPQGVREDQVPDMVRALLVDRFGLELHRGSTMQPIYALVVAKGGLIVKRAVADSGTAAADAGAGTTGFAGEIIERTIPNADGKGETNTISNPQMGTVQVTEGAELFERMDARASTLEGVAELLERMTPVETPVIDITGLKGRYRLVLDVSLNGLPKLAPSSIGDSAAVASWRADREE